MRQYSKPIMVTNEGSISMNRIPPSEKEYSEKWLQDLIHDHPHALPIQEIEPIFAEPFALCKEMETKSGFCDNVLINDRGFLTIVECKLWKNPEARRTVVSQILDYAKDLTRWRFDDLERAVLNSRGNDKTSLIELMQESCPDLDSTEFVDSINTNLANGRILLLIAGDGIRENAEELLDFLNQYSRMRFVLAMIEMPVYRIDGRPNYIVTPRTLVKTVELSRTVDVTSTASAISTPKTGGDVSARPLSGTEAVYYERLDQSLDSDSVEQLKDFINRLKTEHSIRVKPGRGKNLTLNLKSDDDRYNFATINEEGKVYFYGIVSNTRALGDATIGTDYLKGMAELIDGNFIDTYKEWMWCVKKEGEYPLVTDFLKRAEEWKFLIGTSIERIKKYENE